MSYSGAQAKIERTDNGWLVSGSNGLGDNERWVFEDAGEDSVSSLQEALWQVVDCLDGGGSRYDAERITITKRKGDKYTDSIESVV